MQRITSKHVTRGFTLIELLVVIAIIAILASILFPVFARARENARRSSCQSNLKQLGLGVAQYKQDYDERFPIGYYAVGSPATYTTWGTTVQPYVKSTQIFRCPSSTNTVNIGSLNGPRDNDYPINSAITQFWSGSSWDTNNSCNVSNTGPVHDSEIENAVNTTLIIDGDYFAYSNLYAENGYNIKPRHFEGYNIAFADGHVKWLKTMGAASGVAGKYIYDPRNPTTVKGLGGC